MCRITDSDLIGKTIVEADCNSVNCTRLKFSDGTELEMIAENAVNTPYGSIPGIFVECEELDEEDVARHDEIDESNEDK